MRVLNSVPIAEASHPVFFRYLDEADSRDLLEVIHVVHGARDLKAFFRRSRTRP